MKLPLSPGEWLFATSVIYLIAGMINLFVYSFTELEYMQPVWLLITALPLFLPMQKVVDMDPLWKGSQ